MSISQSTIKFISSLQRKKFRQNYHKFTVEGTKIVSELLQQERYLVTDVYATTDWLAENKLDGLLSVEQSKDSSGSHRSKDGSKSETSTTRQQPNFHEVNEGELKKISSLTTPNQVLAIAVIPPAENLATSLVKIKQGWSLYLDGLQTPANLGAILRVADWFGFQQVIAGPGTVDLYNPKSIQATMGCFLRLDYHEADLQTVIAAQPDLPIHAADLDGENIYTFQPPKSGLLVIGNEGRGIRSETRALVQQYLRIPRGPGREAESLNAAVATGILCGQLALGRD